MEMSDQLKAVPLFYHRHPLNKRLGETHSRAESSVDEINLLSLQESNHNSPVVRPAFTIPSALYWLGSSVAEISSIDGNS
jgi:hypothetical protein